MAKQTATLADVVEITQRVVADDVLVHAVWDVVLLGKPASQIAADRNLAESAIRDAVDAVRAAMA